MKKVLNLKWLSIVVFAFLLVGCSDDKVENQTDNKKDTEQTTSYKVKDDRGIEVTFDKVPETVISLQPSNTEILFALGAGDTIIGATEYDVYPKEALEIERVGSTTEFNGERIIELNPDVVLAYSNAPKGSLELLEDAGIKVFVIASSESIADVYENITKIADVMQVSDEAKNLNEEIQAKISEVQEKVAAVETQKTIYFEITPSPSIYTAGSGTFQQELFELANVKNVFDDQESWVQVSEEQVVAKNPEVILTSVDMAGSVDEIVNRTGWDTVTAIQNNEVYNLDKNVTSRPGPRIGEALELIAKTVYPDIFEK